MPPEENSEHSTVDDVIDHQTHDKEETVPEFDDADYPEYDDRFEDPTFLVVMSVYLGLFLAVIFGHIRELLRYFGLDKTMLTKEYGNEGFVPLYNSFESFYTRNIYQRASPNFSHPVAGVPGAEIELWDRKFGYFNEGVKVLDTKKKYINIGSYNYLGFAENNGRCSAETIKEIRHRQGTTAGCSRAELGSLAIHAELERLIARFVGKEDCLVFGMGFATNSMNIATLVDEGCLLISDELNHASLVLGARLSGAKIKVFKHNDMANLEKILRNSIIYGQPRTHRPWKKILIVVEGIYSMEGTSCKLPEIVALKKKYKAYLYVDEAHSIGAMGPTGRGISEHYGVDTADIDILMGTFSKSFGGAGGYITSDRRTIAHLRNTSHAHTYSSGMSPPVCRQVLAATQAIMGLDGTNDGVRRIRQLALNTKYFRRELQRRGYIVYGELDSPVVPVLISNLALTTAFAKMTRAYGLASVIVGFPATPMLGSRVRFCISASHTRQHLDQILDLLEKLEPELGLQLSSRHKKNKGVKNKSCSAITQKGSH